MWRAPCKTAVAIHDKSNMTRNLPRPKHAHGQPLQQENDA